MTRFYYKTSRRTGVSMGFGGLLTFPLIVAIFLFPVIMLMGIWELCKLLPRPFHVVLFTVILVVLYIAGSSANG